jgi:predicted TIM-barrel fold metal-dependent hydrolase
VVSFVILDYETYWNPEGGGNLGRLVELFDEVSRDYRAVLFPPSRDQRPRNLELRETLDGFLERDRFVPCAYINPNLYDAPEELETAVERNGFRGMKLMPTIHRYNVDSLVTHPVMEKALDLGIPVTIHSSGEGGYPRLIAKLADAFPDVPIIMDHSGYRYFQAEALEAGRGHENVYFGLSLVAEPGYIDRIASEVGPDRLIFGSNAQGGIPRIGVMVFEYTGLTKKEKRMALGENLARLLKL